MITESSGIFDSGRNDSFDGRVVPSYGYVRALKLGASNNDLRFVKLTRV